MDKNMVSRRTLLKSGSLLATASIVGFGGMFGTRTLAAADETAQEVIDIAATAELFATTHYYRAIENAKAMGMGAGEISYLQAGLEQ